MFQLERVLESITIRLSFFPLSSCIREGTCSPLSPQQTRTQRKREGCLGDCVSHAKDIVQDKRRESAG